MRLESHVVRMGAMTNA